MFVSLLRSIPLKNFFVEKFADSSNTFLCWLITSLVFATVFSILLSQYIPLVPKAVEDVHVFGYQLNKFGYTLACIILFYLSKAFLSYLFYSGIGNIRKWGIFYFTVTKFYFALSVILIILCIYHYYFDIDKREALHIYLFSAGIVFIFKIIFYFFHKNQILPIKWYYKFLYICTLQIAPLFVLWRTLFF